MGFRWLGEWAWVYGDVGGEEVGNFSHVNDTQAVHEAAAEGESPAVIKVFERQ